ncbi:phasin family protein [Dyella sp. LX-66]|uniref:phasin family protein n=1 Tax=unclassified Dyella TaxID=2634549 RepID=UPI001BE099AE|nr:MULTISPECIES: phasin family protein [unclassified Dyella]MBT2119475.1 phasin family protein [Dyella sp. LX-1]MBT2141809.1 phasin family protein [Dyella sp. LX-66]
MTQQLNAQVFAYAKQLTDNAFKAQSVAFKALEKIAELQIQALEKQSQVTSEYIADALETRDIEGLRTLWEKGSALSRENAERAVAVTQEIIAVTQKTAESLTALVQEQQQAANDAVSAPVAAVKKAAAAAAAK